MIDLGFFFVKNSLIFIYLIGRERSPSFISQPIKYEIIWFINLINIMNDEVLFTQQLLYMMM